MENQEWSAPSVFTVTPTQILVGVVFFVALLYGQRDLIVLTLLVLGVIGGARLWASISIADLAATLDVDKRRVFPGEPVTLTTRVENVKLIPIWLELTVPIGDLLQHSARERAVTKMTSLLWYERTQFQWELVAARRGVCQIGPLEIDAGDLFSFFSRHQRGRDAPTLIVYPRLVRLKPLPLSRRDFFGVPRATSPVQDPIYILGTRDYQPGQPAKHIHWKASARRNQLQEKIFESTVQEKILLVIDVEPFARRDAESDLERMLEIVASIAVRLDRQGRSVGLVTNGALKGKDSAGVPVARNDQQLATILEILARLEMKPARAIKDALRRGLADTWGVSCIYFTRQADETVFPADQFFAQHKTPVVFVVCQPRADEETETRPRIYSLDDLRLAEVESK